MFKIDSPVTNAWIDKIAIIFIVIAIFLFQLRWINKKITNFVANYLYNKVKLMENKPLNRIKVMLAERMMTNKDLAEK